MHTYVNRSPTRNQRRQRKLAWQKLMGFALVVLSIAAVFAMAGGHGAAESDCGIVLFTVPLGLFLLFSKRSITD